MEERLWILKDGELKEDAIWQRSSKGKGYERD